MYTVQKGDNLWAIAEKHYGKGTGAKHTEIVKANSPPVTNPDMIQNAGIAMCVVQLAIAGWLISR